MFKQPRFTSLSSIKKDNDIGFSPDSFCLCFLKAKTNTRHLNVFCLRTRSSFEEHYNFNHSIEFTSQLSRLLKSMQFSIENHFLMIFSVKKADLIKITFIKSAIPCRKQLKSGGRYRARTSDPLLVREVLSQLS